MDAFRCPDLIHVKMVEGNTKVYTFLSLDIVYEKDVTASTFGLGSRPYGFIISERHTSLMPTSET